MADKLMTGAKASILDAVGGTPIVKLNKVGNHTRANLYVKCEYMNPGGSMKDRIGINIVNLAEKMGQLKPGGTIVEATSGNTGMGLALVAAVRGYKAVFVMPDKQSEEKRQALRSVGAKVVICPTDVEPDDPRSYYCVSRRIAEETPNAFYANQYHNPANPESHYLSTGPELWEQTAGELDVFVSGMGTGGTLSGTGKFLKEKKPAVKIVGVDPIGSLYYDLYKTGRMTKAHPYKVEGIGEDFVPSTMNLKILDDVVQVTDRECFMTARDLIRKEGILIGGSAGAAVAGAVKYAEMSGKRENIVVLLPDSSSRYLSKFLNDDWMRENGFLGPETSAGKVRDILARRKDPEVITADANEAVGVVVERLKSRGISQVPVLEAGKLMGIVNEVDILKHLVGGAANMKTPVRDIAEDNFATVAPESSVAFLSDHFNRGKVVIVMDGTRLAGVITKIDLIDHLAGMLG
ncbi:MAG: pyridoxal-phosphate dependent enzyme [Deltaproteobacteria bacterium]|nr:pyridoxal-phosphate dependent enzyme [Deltaproteobacteria bacterium]